MQSPWVTRLLLLSLFLGIAKFQPFLGWLIALGCLGYAGYSLYGAVLSPSGQPAASKGPPLRPGVSDTPKDVAIALKKKIFGQDTVCDEVAQTLYLRLNASRPGKPLAVFCFAGPPGVGKSYFAKVLNNILFGVPETLFHFDMPQYDQPYAATGLFGQPPGFGSGQYGQLTAALRDFPNSIILLDEFEKAHVDVHRRFLTAWNDGFITEASDGARFSTAQAIFILTTNAAGDAVGDLADRYSADRETLLRSTRAALEQSGFTPEVLSRIDQIFAFRRLDLDLMNIARVAAVEIVNIVQQQGMNVIDGGIDPKILVGLVESLLRLGGRARDVVREIERILMPGIIEAKKQNARTIGLEDVNGKVEVHILEFFP